MNIFEERKAELGISYTDIANEIGLTRSGVCRIIRTPYRTSLNSLSRVGEILGIPFDVIKSEHEKAKEDRKMEKNNDRK